MISPLCGEGSTKLWDPTTPVGAFKASFESESGKSSAGFDRSVMIYFLSVGFPRWEGYTVYNDPEVAFLISRGDLAPPGEGTFLRQNWGIFVLIGSVAAVAAVLFVFRAKIKNAFPRLRKPREPVQHREPKVEIPASQRHSLSPSILYRANERALRKR